MPYLTPDSAPATTVCRTLVIPDDANWKAIVNGALSELIKPTRFEQFGTATPDEVAAVFQQMFYDYLESECNPVTYPKRAEISHFSSTPLAGGLISWLVNAGQINNGVARQFPAALGDKWSNQVFLGAGDYIVSVIGIKSSGGGQLNLLLDDVVIGTVDFYAAATTLNVMISNIATITNPGPHTVKGEIVGKDASSAGYVANITAIYFKPLMGD